jgi:predicted TIM-barrel fold metal-dependent hydrolase
MKTFLVTFVTDHLGRKHTTLRHAESEKAVRAWAKRTKTFFVKLKIEELK